MLHEQIAVHRSQALPPVITPTAGAPRRVSPVEARRIPLLPMAGDPSGDETGWVVLVFVGGVDSPAPRLDVAYVERAADLPPTPALNALVCAAPAQLLRQEESRAGSYLLDARLEGLWRALVRMRGDDAAARVCRQLKLFELTFEAIQAVGEGVLPCATAAACLPIAERERLAAAERFIAERYREKLTIDTVARACGLGRGKLIRGFRDLFGRTIYEAITEARLRDASQALRATRLPISRIAYDIGYQSNAAFSRAFARRFGVAPTLFRQT